MELGTTYRYKSSGAKRSLVEKSETFQYVPLIENLQWLLQNMDLYQEVGGCTLWSQNLSMYGNCAFNLFLLQVFKEHACNSTTHLYDYCDGEVYKEHPLFSVDKRALQLVIYTDDVETANPLGSYHGKHKLSKLVCVYYYI